MSRPTTAATLALAVLVASAAAAFGAARTQRAGSVEAARARNLNAIFERDGAVLCQLADPATASQLRRLVAAVRVDPNWRVRTDCAHVAAPMIGYPHENVGVLLVGGRVLSVAREPNREGRERRLSRCRDTRPFPAPAYDLRQRAPRLADAGRADTVWLTKTRSGWRTANPSLSFLVARGGDVLAAAGTLIESPRSRAATTSALTCL